MVKSETIGNMESHIISKEEEHLIIQLKENVKDILPQKWQSKSEEDQKLFFVRWIRARENDLEKATSMLRKHFEWRVERKADEILKTTPHPFFAQTFPHELLGADKKGQPLYCIPYSEWDFRNVVNDKERLEEFEDFLTHFFEGIMKAIETAHENRAADHPPITQMTLLVDAKDFPYGQLVKYSAIKKILQTGSVFEAHYPEILFLCIFINCPSYMDVFMGLLKSVLPAKTMSKIKLCTSFKKWQNEISEIADPAIIPERYGGTLKNTIKDA